jgi:hypothetical protein
VFYALSQALAAQADTSISELARERYLELMNDGRKSLSPNFKIKSVDDFPSSPYLYTNEKAIHELYLHLRAEAESYQYLRVSYMNDRLREGMHPDTHPDFWKGWEEPELPSLEMPNSAQVKREEAAKMFRQYGTYLLAGLTLLCIGITIGRRRTTWG